LERVGRDWSFDSFFTRWFIINYFTDTYCAQGTVKEIAFAVKNNKDKLYSNKSLLLYGNGDGGGGPLQPMIERLTRLQAVEGLPATIEFKNPNTFYDQLAEHSKDLNVWQGELYFELHRGTYTSHCIIKKYNRMCELLLREVEILYVLGCTLGVAQYPYKELDHLWKLVLLNQFHDVLPGSSIQIVYPDAIKVILY
jgi:alpha-mannosidase